MSVVMESSSSPLRSPLDAVADQLPQTSPSPSPDNGVQNEDEQAKALHKFTSTLSGLGLRPPFNMNVLPPFLAALQSSPLALHQQLLSLSGLPTGVEDDEDTENVAAAEPEDLTVSGLRKGAKKDDEDGAEDSLPGGAGAPSTGTQQNWSYEEQFKQLYELSDDVKRKEWLDDWLSFMHRIGKPVTRIPIMAKQVLDLYELYRLVVQHGGLVEIINKKLWREITKGLNLPSSITSAAFTLRTQYQKFLYDYECEKEGLSTPADLQQAIDGNRREGRRSTANSSTSSFPLGFPLGHPSAAAASLLGKHLNGALNMRNDFLDDDVSTSLANVSTTQQASLLAAYRAEQLAVFEAQQRQLERAQRAAVEAVARQSLSGALSGRESTSSVDSEPSAKKIRSSPRDEPAPPANATAHIKITSRTADGRSTAENSLVVSMEINGTMYQGVLFALGGEDTPAQNALKIGL